MFNVEFRFVLLTCEQNLKQDKTILNNFSVTYIVIQNLDDNQKQFTLQKWFTKVFKSMNGAQAFN
jgi:hypothetical protein